MEEALKQPFTVQTQEQQTGQLQIMDQDQRSKRPNGRSAQTKQAQQMSLMMKMILTSHKNAHAATVELKQPLLVYFANISTATNAPTPQRGHTQALQ